MQEINNDITINNDNKLYTDKYSGSNLNRNDSNNNNANRKNNNNYSRRRKNLANENKVNMFLAPIIFIVAFLPLITKLKTFPTKANHFPWYERVDNISDFFLYYKHIALLVVTLIMIFFLVYRAIKRRSSLSFNYLFIPLAVYALMIIISTILSDSKYFSLHGSFDQFETVFASLAYCIIVYYVYVNVKSEQDFKVIIRWLLFSTLILGTLGLTQFFKHDFFATEFGTRLITTAAYKKEFGALTFNFDDETVYLTLFNPNYVGVYVAMILPTLLILMIFSKKVIFSILSFIAIIALLFSAIGSRSLAGLIGLAVASFTMLLFMWRFLLKRFYISIPLFLLLAVALFLLNKQTDNLMINRVKGIFDLQKTDAALTAVETKDDHVAITYKGHELNIRFVADSDKTKFAFAFTDENNENIESNYHAEKGYYTLEDERYTGFIISLLGVDNDIAFCVKIDNRDWIFTNLIKDGTYYYYNRFYTWDKIIDPPSSVFNGYEAFASKRGYIWSRSIPLVKKNILVGSGPNTFALEFPQQDYLGFINYGYEYQILSKPHSMYLQTAIQTGLISLIAFLVFYGMYFVSSIKLYISGRYNSYFARAGVAIFVGTITYMFTGLTNDSSLVVTPIFWVLMGLGMVANKKARPLILEEREELKHLKDN